MSNYRLLKESLGEALYLKGQLESGKRKDLSKAEANELHASVIRKLAILKFKMKNSGWGTIYRVNTSSGFIYLVNILEDEIAEILGDMVPGIEIYNFEKIETKIFSTLVGKF